MVKTKNILEQDFIHPHDIETEKHVLGCIMIEGKSFIEVIDLLTVEMFYAEQHRVIYKTITELYDKGSPLDLLTIKIELDRCGIIEEAGGVSYLSKLTHSILSSINLRYYAQIIFDKYLQRKLIENKTRQLRRLHNDIDFDLMEELNQQHNEDTDFSNLITKRNSKTKTSISDIVPDVIDNYIKLSKSDNNNFYAIGIDVVDKNLKIDKGDLVLLAARPGMGKTAVALQIIRNYSKRGLRGKMYSLEMTKEKLVSRIIIGEARVSSNRFKFGKLTSSEVLLMNKTKEMFNSWKLNIDDKSGIGLRDIEADCLMEAQNGLDFIVIDYLGLIKLPNKNTRNEELGMVSRTLKALAKKCGIPVIALHQLSRAVESRGNKRPLLSDLRDSGELEQDADIIMFLYRDAYYTNEEGTEMELIIAKHREGETGVFKINHDEQLSNFFGETNVNCVFDVKGDFDNPNARIEKDVPF